MKRFDFDNTNRICKKTKYSKYFLLLTSTPENFKLSLFSYDKEFTPIIKGKSVGITFLTFIEPRDRSKCIEMIEKSNNKISLFCFDQNIFLHKDSLATNLSNEITSIHSMSLNLVVTLKQLSIANNRNSYKNQLDNLENQTKNACREYLSKIMAYLEDFFLQ